ncbi:hypothetical protein JB92DRAFT_2869103 [Gautieria morchelliformis]|nr:hypothetical protein JB92DRAFT_2869103 [Gautieria morchelliformis]
MVPKTECVKLTHDISPLPAFDTNGGDPIIPSQYKRFLKGALEIHFTLTWVFSGKNAKAMNIPVIREMLVVSPRLPPVALPMKLEKI